MPKKTNKNLEIVITILFEFGAYIFAVLGVLSSKYLPQMKNGITGVEISMPTFEEMIASFIAALLVTFFIEDREKDKMSNIKKRMLTYFAYGVMFSQIVEILVA